MSSGQRIGTLECTIECKLSRPEFDLTYCGCGNLVYLDPPPTGEDLKALYEEQDQFTDDTYTAPQRIETILEYMGSSLERIQDSRGFGKAPVRVLEVGAGFAWMCRAAKRLNKANRTTAQDVSAEVRKACTWVDSYVHGTIHEPAIASSGPYDVISLTHVIEHLLDPVDVITQCSRLLSERGVIFITAPHRPCGWVAGSTDLEPWKRYSLLHVPAHIQYFSRGSMQRLADRAGAQLLHWEDGHENGEAFEAWLAKRGSTNWRHRAVRWLSFLR
jgi:2-polyprenyl-3-methyl-5-hydroxy-6-metoxy-1,4-benzoquinol methylase